MFCRNCGKELGDNENFCPKCGQAVVQEEIDKVVMHAPNGDIIENRKPEPVTPNENVSAPPATPTAKKFSLNWKWLIPIGCVLALVVVIFAVRALSGGGEPHVPDTVGTAMPTNQPSRPWESSFPASAQTVSNPNSSPSNDTMMGQKNVKIDTTTVKLTEDQKKILEYYDNDYFRLNDYELMKRYPQVYEGAQIELSGVVTKVLSSTNDEYSVLMRLQSQEGDFYYRGGNGDAVYEDYLEKVKNDYIVVNGRQRDARLMEGDYLRIYGRYVSLDPYDIDSTSYVIPTVFAYSEYIITNPYEEGPSLVVPKFDHNFIKAVAQIVFGDVEVRKPVEGEDLDEMTGWNEINRPFFVVELENQSNAQFGKYRFYTQTGKIEDARTSSDFWVKGTDENIDRQIQFSADFEHYFLFAFDTSLGSLTLSYYDTSFTKLWSRDFEETTSAVYDYTENNIYLIANNSMYIINTETGEDTYPSAFVGSKADVRKLNDGVFLVDGQSPSDTFMKTDLKGNIIWKTNSPDYGIYPSGIQLINDTIVVAGDTGNYYVLDNETGNLDLHTQSFLDGSN